MILKTITYLLHFYTRIPIYYILFVVDSEEYEITNHDLKSYYIFIIFIITLLLIDFLIITKMKLSYIYGVLSNIITIWFIFLLYKGFWRADISYYGSNINLNVIHTIYISIIWYYMIITCFYVYKLKLYTLTGNATEKPHQKVFKQ